ncbi:uncharacterized protein LOC130756685 isoform X3 [Actinidia eriantha]|uniref:uncharacterized protein LOC130756685 isoform X3 n=1 Tax=Actinidia eriantha TaxID=165200 RepID=UPI00258D03EA|nr:uncharacterized protein LOC130756685 isoform X3 [Actinidia eriantha]
MAASSKFDMSSSSPDRPLYAQRASYTAASLDRSGSFRENMENPILSSLPSMSRSSSSVSQGDVMNFLQCLWFDPKLMVADHKFSRQVDFKRLTSAALGFPVDDSPSGSSKGKPLPSPSPEELKRLKDGLCESSIKARERLKIFSEALSIVNKCFPSILSRKRSRLDVLSADRSSALFPSDRTVMGSGIAKMGTQSHSIASGFELEPQKSDERTKIAIPNKRTRTSMVDADVRANTPARPSGNMDRDREVLRLSNSGAAQGEERTLSIGVDGWEKSKMKKKRSGIKPDVSPSTVVTKPVDGYREPRQGMQPRLLADARSRLNDTHGFRPGVVNGAVTVGKADGTSQATSLGMRSSIPKVDQDSNSRLHDRRDRPAASDKERVNLRAVNKTNAREDFSSASPTSNTKMNSAARAPRSVSNVIHKLSPVVQRTTVANDWELSHCPNKIVPAVGANNRKRTPSTRSSSPPVARWAGQRPQKISRTARRRNFGPIVSSNDENPASDAVCDVVGNENGASVARRLSSNSPQQVKSKGDHFSTAALSESEESGAAEVKPRDKGKKTDEVDEKASPNVQKVSALVLPPRKNKLVSGDDLGDGVRRQGRTGRVLTSTRSLMPMTGEKLGNVGTAKQLRSARLSFERTESKAGRPPTRKLSDRKAYTRHKNTTISAAADFLVGSDDGHEELLAAAAAVTNPAHCFSSSFWRQMEPYFGFISDVDIAFLKQQGSLGSTAPTPITVPLDVDSFSTVSNGLGLIKPERDMDETKDVGLIPDPFVPATNSKEIPLCQRLVSALISEEEEEFYCGRSEDLEFDVYGSEFEPDALEYRTMNHQSLGRFQLAERAGLNGYRITATERSLNELDHSLLDSDVMAIPEKGMMSNFEYSQNGLLSDQAFATDKTCSEFQYGNMSIDEKILLEMQSVGLHLEPMPDLTQTGDEEINEDINRLEDKYREQVTKKKALFGQLLNSALEMREVQEKEFEHRALDKLIAMAYEKYMQTCRGSNASGGKSASSKMAKQAALAFVKRTLERCQHFEDTGKSCFSEPLFRDMFISGSSRLNDAQQADFATDGESSKQYANTPGCSLEVRVSAPVGNQQSPSLTNHDVYSANALLSFNNSSELMIGKEDAWSNRVKKRELLLDDVGGAIGTSTAPSGIGSSLSSSAKGKRSERDREGKGNSREVLSRTNKVDRPTSGNIKGERKCKTKPKQKTTQLSASVSDLLGKLPEQPKATLSGVSKSSEVTTSGSVKGKDEFSLDVLDDREAIDLSHLQLPGMDVLGVPDDLGGQGQDIGSWLNIDDDGLQDLDDFSGLEIPMDDLADLNMMATIRLYIIPETPAQVF